jgi:WD40 repeat protein
MLLSLRALVLAVVLLSGWPVLAQDSRGFLGADLQDITRQEADQLGWESPRGAKVTRPRPGGPAAGAGLEAGDIVVSLDGREIESAAALNAGIDAKPAGSQIRLRLLRGGRERTLTVTLGVRPVDLGQPLASAAKDQPILMLDPGGHMALVKGLDFTRDGRLLISAGDDKVVRVWDWQAGRTLRTLRGQVGLGHEGKTFALALSPNGRWLAVAGWMGGNCGTSHCDIRIYDFATGRLAGVLHGHTDVVHALAFSPDGKLISGGSLNDRTAIIWDVERRVALQRLRGHNGQIYGVGFTPDGQRAVTGSYDTTLKLWSVRDGREIATMPGHTDRIQSLAVSPNGTIASGGAAGEIRLWDGRTGAQLRHLANQGGLVGGLRFSSDGRLLLSTCGSGGCNYSQSVWDIATGNRRATYTKHDNTARPVAVSPIGNVAATGGFNGDIQIWDLETGNNRKVLAGTGAPRWSVGFSADGRSIAWGHTWSTHDPAKGYGPLLWSLRLPFGTQTLGRPEPITDKSGTGFVRARPALGAYSLAHRSGGIYRSDAFLDIRKDGQTVAVIERDSASGFEHRSYTLTPDGRTVISGGSGGVLTAHELNGAKIGDFFGHDSEVWGLAPSPDGRFLVTGSADQTVRLWNLKTRELIVSLFQARDGEWVMWTPQGYYTGSPGSDKIVGWQINKGQGQEAEYVGAEQLRQHLNRPDIIDKAIVLASAEQAVREAPGTSFKLADLLARPVPRFRIVSPSPGASERAGRTAVRIAIEPTPDPVRLIRIQVNGRQVGEEVPAIGSGGFAGGERALYVPLAKGRNEIRVALTNVIGEKAETLIVNHDNEGDLDQRGVLHILAIGVNDYKGLGNTCGVNGTQTCNLGFPRNDAIKFADAVEKRLGPSHSLVIKRVLVNGGDPKDVPTANNITDAVELLRHARETDTVVLFIAGHGSNEGPDYRFLPTNAEWSGGMLRGSTVVPWQVLQGAVEAAKGRRILFVDTCHSGGAYNQRLGNAAYHANIVAYTAARFDQLALEDPSLGHGLFTYAVVEALQGKGDLAQRRQLSTRELADYLRVRVGMLARGLKGDQEPQYFKGRDAEDFVLARW